MFHLSRWLDLITVWWCHRFFAHSNNFSCSLNFFFSFSFGYLTGLLVVLWAAHWPATSSSFLERERGVPSSFNTNFAGHQSLTGDGQTPCCYRTRHPWREATGLSVVTASSFFFSSPFSVVPVMYCDVIGFTPSPDCSALSYFLFIFFFFKLLSLFVWFPRWCQNSVISFSLRVSQKSTLDFFLRIVIY